MRRVLLLARLGCYPTDLARDECDRVSAAPDAHDGLLDTVPV